MLPIVGQTTYVLCAVRGPAAAQERRKSATAPPSSAALNPRAGEGVYGSPYVFRINGSGHDESGAPCGRADNADKFIRHYEEKFLNNIDDITRVNQFGMDDAEYAIVTFGCSTRAAKAAMKQARARGIKAGVLQIVTLWPFPEAVVREVNKRGFCFRSFCFGKFIYNKRYFDSARDDKI